MSYSGNPFHGEQVAPRQEEDPILSLESKIGEYHIAIVRIALGLRNEILKNIEASGQEPDPVGIDIYVFDSSVPFEAVQNIPRPGNNVTMSEAFAAEKEIGPAKIQIDLYPVEHMDRGETRPETMIIRLDGDQGITLEFFPITDNRNDQPKWVKVKYPENREDLSTSIGYRSARITSIRYLDKPDPADILLEGIKASQVETALRRAANKAKGYLEEMADIETGKTHMRVHGMSRDGKMKSFFVRAKDT